MSAGMWEAQVGPLEHGMTEPKSLKELLRWQSLAEHCEMDTLDSREMARRLRKLAERHQRKTEFRHGMHQVYCDGCGHLWPCPDAEIIEGRS